MDEFILAKVISLRGLGYTHAEIGGKLDLKTHQIQYALEQVNEDAREKGDTETYIKIMGAGVGPRIAEIAGKLC